MNLSISKSVSMNKDFTSTPVTIRKSGGNIPAVIVQLGSAYGGPEYFAIRAKDAATLGEAILTVAREFPPEAVARLKVTYISASSGNEKTVELDDFRIEGEKWIGTVNGAEVYARPLHTFVKLAGV